MSVPCEGYVAYILLSPCVESPFCGHETYRKWITSSSRRMLMELRQREPQHHSALHRKPCQRAHPPHRGMRRNPPQSPAPPRFLHNVDVSAYLSSGHRQWAFAAHLCGLWASPQSPLRAGRGVCDGRRRYAYTRRRGLRSDDDETLRSPCSPDAYAGEISP